MELKIELWKVLTEDICDMKKHIAILNDEYGKIACDMVEVKTRLIDMKVNLKEWKDDLKKFLFQGIFVVIVIEVIMKIFR